MPERNGFTLLELLLTITMISLLLALTVPAWRNALASSRVTSETNALVRAVHAARSEAVKRAGRAVICPSEDGRQCDPSGAGWSIGWLVFADRDRTWPPTVADADRILMRHRVDTRVTIDANREFFAFRYLSRRSSNGTLILCSRGSTKHLRAVVISYTGRPRIARRRSDGSEYACKR